MKHILFLIFAIVNLSAQTSQANQTCKACHPKIYEEYQHSHHKNASIFNDPIHKAIWELHPKRQKGDYSACAKCHTPNDKALQGVPIPNDAQPHEPIACISCHQIENISMHAKANKNHYTQNEKLMFSADETKKGTKLEYKEVKSFFGLSTKKIGSPYHDIDYGNENFYNANVCMGCHSHKQNAHDFAICDLEVKEGTSKETCISCHMPQTAGAMANQHKTPTHAFHGSTALVDNPTHLGKYIKLSFDKKAHGFTVSIENKANHTLAPHPLRLSKLIITINREGKEIVLEESFVNVIGIDGKPSMPWLANSVIKDTTIKAYETRKVTFDTPLHAGDQIILRFGYHKVNPKAATTLGIGEDETKFITLVKETLTI